MRFFGQQCNGLGCESLAAIIYGDNEARRILVELNPFSSDNNHLASPEAVTAKALLQLGKQGWELESVSPNSKTDPNSRSAVYHLKRQIHAAPSKPEGAVQ